MWRNRTGQFRRRGGFARGKDTKFVRNNSNLHDRGIQRRDDFRDRNRAGLEDDSRINRDYDRGLRVQSRNFDVDESRYVRPGLENREDDYLTVRDPQTDIHFETMNRQDEFQDNVAYREQDDRRNVVEDVRGYGNYVHLDNDVYWNDKKQDRLDDFRNRDLEFRPDDQHSRRETFEFTIDTSDRYVDEHRNSITDFRSSDLHHQGHDQQAARHETFNENRTGQHHHSVNYRNQPDQRPNYGRDEQTSHRGRDDRHTSDWRKERFNERKQVYKTDQDKKSYDRRQSSRSTDRSGGHGKQHDFARSSSSERRNRESKNSEVSKNNDNKMKKNDSKLNRSDKDTHSKGRSETTSVQDHKNSDRRDAKKSKVSATKDTNTSSKENNVKNMEKISGSSKNDQSKQKSDMVSTSKKREDKPMSRSSSRADSNSFKRPGEKHSSRPRSNSGRKLESDTGHFDDADILSIMADDDGFEKEMRAFNNSGERSRSRTRNSRDRGSQLDSSGMEKASERQSHSKEKENSNRQKSNRKSGSNEQHKHSRENSDRPDNRPVFNKHTKASTSKFGSNTSETDTGRRIQTDNRSRVSMSTNKFRTDFISEQRHKDHRLGSRLSGRFINNNFGGRSRFSAASKIKDSYLKRKKTFQGITNKKFENRHMSKPFAVINKHSNLSMQNTYVKSEVGKTGALLKEDRIMENRGFSNNRNMDQDRQGFQDKRENEYNRSFKTFPKTQNIKGNRFQREGAKFENKDRFTKRPFKARDVAYQRVKQKYFRGGFSQNKNNRGFRGGYNDYGRKKRDTHKNWDGRSESDNENTPDVIQDDISNIESPLEDQAVELNPQQVIFIPNNDLQSGQPHMVDQFGQIILNPEVGLQQNEDAVPVQYLQQQFHHPDGVPQGEQVVFIPFVNNQDPSDFSGNLPMAFNENIDMLDVDKANHEEHKGNNMSGNKATHARKKPLSQKARAKLRKSLEIKRKLRLEKEIEKKLLKKLLNNPDVNKVVRESNAAKKKPVIKRISPPSSSYQSKKQYKLVRRGNDTGDLDDVSEDDAKYDNVSDLEEISEFEDADEGNDEYDSKPGKRPVFRKPGQPRMNKNFTDVSRNVKIPGTLGDVRRVVDNSSNQPSGRTAVHGSESSQRPNQAHSFRKFQQGDKSRRSVYIENPNNVIGQKRSNNTSGYETHQLKKRRSISPIEITVSNDKYSERTHQNSGIEMNDYVQYDSSNRKDERKSSTRQNYSADGNGGHYERSRNEEYDEGNMDMYTDERERKKQSHRENSRISEKNSRDENKYKNERNHSKNDAYERREMDEGNKGKYVDKKVYRSEERVENRSRKNVNYKEHAQDKHADTYDESSTRRWHSSWQGRNDKYDRRNEKTREINVKNERNDLFIGDKGQHDDRNSGYNKQRHNRDRVDSPQLGSNRNIKGNNFVSNINQSQFQMNQPMMQQSMHSQPFMSTQSPSIPLHGQSVMQLSNSGSSVDHSLPPVQNTPMSMPPFPPPGISVGPDMSLPPPVMNVVGTPTSMATMAIQQQPNSVQPFQQQPMQQMNMQQQAVQQQQFQNMQPQFQQQQQHQFQQMQTQPQMIQQTNSNFQSHQPAFQTNIRTSQQMSLQQMQPGQYQQTQSGVNMMPVNQSQQTGSMNQGQRGSNQQGISTSGNLPRYMAASQQQTVRGVKGTLKHSVDNSTVRRGQQVLSSGTRTRVSNSQTMSRRQGGRNQSNFSPSGDFDRYGKEEEENDMDDDEYMEMLCSKCDKVFLSGEVMRRHGRWHDKVETNAKSFRCDQCEQGFSSSYGHSEHMSTKHSVDSWNCSLCDMTFSTSSGLGQHVRHASHKDMKVKFVCSLCPASFMVLSQLIQHRNDNHQFNAGYSGLRKY